MKKILLILIAMLIAEASMAAGSGTPRFKVARISQWSNGSLKIYTDTSSVNGLEGCTATDNSLAVTGDKLVRNEFLSMALSAQARGTDLYAWVYGCCVTHNGNESPCINTLSSF